LNPARLRSLAVPTQVVCGGLSHPAVRRANELISVHAPDAWFVGIEDAAHFAIARHAAKMADIVARHVTDQAAQAALASLP